MFGWKKNKQKQRQKEAAALSGDPDEPEERDEREVLEEISARLVTMLPKWGIDGGDYADDHHLELDGDLMNAISNACSRGDWVTTDSRGRPVAVSGTHADSAEYRKLFGVVSANGESKPAQAYACALAKTLAVRGFLTGLARRAIVEDCMASVLVVFNTESFMPIETKDRYDQLSDCVATAIIAEMDHMVRTQPRGYGFDPDDGTYDSALAEALKGLRSRIGIQAFPLCGTSIPADQVYILSKVFNERSNTGVSFFVDVGTPEESGVCLRMEPLTTVDGENLSRSFPKATGVQGYPLDYIFYLSPYKWSDLPIRLVDACAPSLKNQERKKALLRVNMASPILATSPQQVQGALSRWLGSSVEVSVYDVQPLSVATALGKRMSSDFKGSIRPIAWAPPHPSTAPVWNIIPADQQTQHVSPLRIKSVNFLPDPEHDARMGNASLHALYPPLDGLKSRGGAEVLHALARPEAGARRTGLLHLLFIENPKEKGYGVYGLFQGASLNKHAGVHLARFSTINRNATIETTELMLQALTGGSHLQTLPSLNFTKLNTAKSDVIIEDADYYLALGSPITGWFVLLLHPASKSRLPSSSGSTSTDAGNPDIGRQQAMRIIEDYCASRFKCDKLHKATQAVSQGELCTTWRRFGIGGKKKEPWFVKTYVEDSLMDRKEALKKVWPVLEKADLMPPRLEAAFLNDSNEDDPANRDTAWVWIVLTPKFVTLKELVSAKSTDNSQMLKLRDALRSFYSRALKSGLAFSDCSIDDLVVNEAQDQIWLIDFGSYEPMATFLPSTNPGKADYKDPGTIARIIGGEPFDDRAKLQCHAYNLALLEYRLWGAGLTPEWPVSAELLATNPDEYEMCVEDALQDLRDVMVGRGMPVADVDLIVKELADMTVFDVTARTLPAGW